MANLGFELNVAEEKEGFYSGKDIFEPGWYQFRITKEEWKDTPSGGKRLVFTLSTDDGKNLEHGLNLVNNNPKAVSIARGELAKIADAIGHRGMLNNTDVLFGRPFMAKVIKEDYTFTDNEGNEKTTPTNKVKDYRPAEMKPKSNTSKPTVDGW